MVPGSQPAVDAPAGDPYRPGRIWWDVYGELWVILEDGTALMCNIQEGELTEARDPATCDLVEPAQAPLHASGKALLANR